MFFVLPKYRVRLVSSGKNVHLFIFNSSSFSQLMSVNLFRRGLAIDPALLNKRSTAAEDGSAVLYLINTNLPDGM